MTGGGPVTARTPKAWVVMAVHDGYDPRLTAQGVGVGGDGVKKNFFRMTAMPMLSPHETLGPIEVAQGMAREAVTHWLVAGRPV
ncbi:hypothetical protein GCM10010532_061090 [Dactylosporangium siamense]|uniref:Uncharacterized protein n=1 Tax=Dactylosporangium siamense TaxID=685454 RepID=A0A919PX32_9ACTN|nr:hypothetical protein Dsi01nite_081290 [Dactylosporangium siamense]